MRNSLLICVTLAWAGMPLEVSAADSPAFVLGDSQSGKKTRASEISNSTTRGSVLDKIEHEAQGCATAADAVAVYELHLARPDVSNEEKLIVEQSLSKWRDRARQGLVRVGADWITKDEYAERRLHARNLIIEALVFVKLGNFKMAEQELTKASETHLDDGDAEMLLGLIHSLVYDNDIVGMKHFRDAAQRSPTNVSAWNNAAVAGFYAGRTTRIADDFACALERAWDEDAQRVANNIASVIRSGRVNSRHTEQLKTLYQMAVRQRRLGPPEPESAGAEIPVTPIFLLPRDWAPTSDDPENQSRPSVQAEATIHVGSGSGFVVAPHHVITNHHVVDGASEIAIGNPEDDDQFCAAELIAANPELDLALLRCPELEAPVIQMRRALPGRGSELMSLGYPQADLLGLGLKSTRGIVVSTPGKSGTRFLHDAVINRGNSGGPLVDRTGAVIGVTVAYLHRRAVDNPYFIGIPVEIVWQFLTASASDVSVSPSEVGTPLEWPDVDAQASKSTVFLRCKFESSAETKR